MISGVTFSEAMAAVVRHVAIPWLGCFGSYRQIIDVFEAEGRDPLGMHPAAPLDVADLYMAIGEPANARDLLSSYAAVEHNPGHADVIVEFLRARGFTDLVPLVNHRTKPKPILE
jgi:hypothetical protein